MGSSKRATVGYWYRLNLMFGLCRGPIDAFLEFRGGDRTAWAGELTESGTISINQPDLWGGEKSEGGIVGDCDVMFGEADQEKNAWALSAFGADQGAYRGRAVLAFKGGKYGAMNPYPKAASFKVRRIKKGWDDDQCWYPEKAELVTADHMAFSAFLIDWRMVGIECIVGNIYSTAGVISKSTVFNPGDGKRHSINMRLNALVELNSYPGGVAVSSHVTRGGMPGDAWQNVYRLDISSPANTYFLNTGAPSAILASIDESFTAEADDGATITLSASSVDGNMVGALQTLRIDVPGMWAGGIFMNPAHILYDSLTSRDMSGEPVALINDASFRAAADKLYAESFGLCTKYDPTSESIEEFQQRICNCIAGSLSRDRRTGLWHLDLVRGDYSLSELPVLTDDDILDYSEEPNVLDDAVNQVVVEWFDPILKETRSTVPVHSLGAITAFGGVIAEALSFPEIPNEPLALRVAARELRSRSSPLRRLELKTNRVAYGWRQGTFFRVQAPKRGIADMVCLVGEIDVGTLRQGAISLTAVQDVFGMPTSVYVAAQPSPDGSDSSPAVPEHQRLFEVPYIEVVQMLSAADLDYLDPDVGYVAAVAGAPGAGLNYTLMTGAAGEVLKNRGSGDWTPVIVVSGGAGYGYRESEITFDESSGLSLVSVPCAALWDDEIVRIDEVNVESGVVTIARGCADTVPQPHLPGSVIFVFDIEAASDGRQYADGETVLAKILTRVGGARLPLAEAMALSCSVKGRWNLPYPPSNLIINGASYPSEVTGELLLEWGTRNRVTQGDVLISSFEESTVPEEGTTFNVRIYSDDDTLLSSESTSETSFSFIEEAVANPLWPDVVLAMRFDGENGSNVFTDLTGKAVTASGDVRVSTAQSMVGSASGHFDGVGDVLTVPSHSDLDLGDTYTIEFRIRPESLSNFGILHRGFYTASGIHEWSGLAFSIRWLGTFLRFYFYGTSNSTEQYIDVPGALSLFEWSSVSMRRYGSSGRVYIDGNLAGSIEGLNTPAPSSQSLRIGMWDYSAGAEYFCGQLQDLRIFKRATLPDSFIPSSKPFSGPMLFESARFRIELESERNGLTSLQKHNVTVSRPAT